MLSRTPYQLVMKRTGRSQREARLQGWAKSILTFHHHPSCPSAPDALIIGSTSC